ncbi:alpha/beta hydrolase fold domain-containing protein [Actinoplanes sp. NPDC051494]|uniref:alpha/beta hydrolase fold domain-containing protein n=1 Tax=Actinoplanes sp. NPDC051494 TaxID=3363907 RepID=UPI00378B5C4A
MDDPTALFIGGLAYAGPRLRLDILRPAAPAGPRPLVVYVHGGGWHEGDRGAGMHPWLNPLLVAHGFVTASLTYTLSGEAHWPAPLDDVRAALRWLRAHAGDHGADPARIGIWGHSAGAHLAATVALTATGADRVQAVALSAVPADLRGERLDSGNEVARLMGPAGDLAEASPVCHVHAAAPPFLIAHGTADAVVPVWQGERLRDTLVAAGAGVRWVPVDGAGHEWADLPGPAGDERAGTFGAVALPFFQEALTFVQNVRPVR